MCRLGSFSEFIPCLTPNDHLPELPSQLISKRVGPDVWIPTQVSIFFPSVLNAVPITNQMILWSIVSFSQFWLTGRSSFLACRFLLGFLQGGFIPDVVLYLSYFYTKTERTWPTLAIPPVSDTCIPVPIRLAFFWISNYISDIVSAFLATGILRLRGVSGKEGWRYLFLLEGLLTLLVGIASWFLMPAGPTQTKAWYRKNGWFSDKCANFSEALNNLY